MSIELFVRIMLRNWWMVLLGLVITAGSSAVFVSMQEPVYRASTVVELRPSDSLESTNEVLNTITALTRRNIINTLARKATSAAMHQQVAEAMVVPVSAVKAAQISAIVIPDTNLIEIRALSTQGDFAAAVSNTVAEQLLGQTIAKVIQMEIIDVAVPPTTPIEPQPQRVITLGIFFGLVLGVIFALLEYTLREMRTSGTWWKGGVFDRLTPVAAGSSTESDAGKAD